MHFIPKPVRRTFSSDYREYQGQLKDMEKVLPKGAPPLRKEGDRPVGPNKFESLPPKERKTLSPGYPVEYQIPVEVGENGKFRPTGAQAALTTGPGLLPAEDRIPGRIDYSRVPDITVTPVVPQGTDLAPGTTLPKTAKVGIPSHPETGFPLLPELKHGAYNLNEYFPAPPVSERARPAMPRNPSADSL